MAKLNYEHVFSAAGFSGESFDIAAGPADVGLIDVLLSVGDGTLTTDAPGILVSSGALGGARALDISALEAESAAQGGEALNGRFFYLSVQNTDILTYDITVSSSSTINGAGTFVISTTGDYMFHHVSGGVWRVNILPRPSESLSVFKRVPFVAGDWAGNSIKCLQTGTPGAGEIGPHELTSYEGYVVQVLNTDLTPSELVNLEIQVAANGDITILKAHRKADFAGTLLICGSLD